MKEKRMNEKSKQMNFIKTKEQGSQRNDQEQQTSNTQGKQAKQPQTQGRWWRNSAPSAASDQPQSHPRHQLAGTVQYEHMHAMTPSNLSASPFFSLMCCCCRCENKKPWLAGGKEPCWSAAAAAGGGAQAPWVAGSSAARHGRPRCAVPWLMACAAAAGRQVQPF